MKQQGFTLIELVVVITILAILAAMALPRFAALQGDARLAKMNGALGSVKGAAAMAHGLLIARGFSATYNGTPAGVTMEGTAPNFVNGYPDAETIAAIAGVISPDYDLTTITATTQTFQADSGHAACVFVYTEAAAGGNQPTYTVVGLTLANCS